MANGRPSTPAPTMAVTLWNAEYHHFTAMVGAGVLSLPYAMSELGW